MNFDRFEVTLGVPLAIGELRVLRRMDAEVLLALPTLKILASPEFSRESGENSVRHILY
jgi:hypothetical protein